MLAGYCPKIAPDVFNEMLRKAGGASNELKMWSCSQHTIKCLLDASEIGARYIVLVTSLDELSPNEYMILEVGFVFDVGRIFFKLVEKVVVPWSACLTTKTLQLPMPSIHNVLEELNPTIFNALRLKLHKVFNVVTLVPPSSSTKKLFDVNLVRHGYILWFKKQNKRPLLNVALDNEASKELLWVVNTDKEEQDNTIVSLRLYSNLEDKVLIEEGRIVMNITTMEDPCDKMSHYIWDPG
uniref:Structural constituent of ribosome n=1 Tax=Solanum tuberosum TaxID=4113 RepID=M1ARB9_SOLTU